MAYNRDNPKYGKSIYDSGEIPDQRLEFFLPEEDIDFNVLASDLKCYLGNGAEVNIGKHHRDGRLGYYIKSAVTVTIPMIEDLKADSARWRAERHKYNVKDYNESRTHENRLRNGPSQRPPAVTGYRQSKGREQQDMYSQGPAAPKPIPKSRHEREEDSYRNPATMSSSPRSNLPPRTSSHYPSTNPSRREDEEYVTEPTSLMSKASHNYPAPSKGIKPPSRRHQEDTSGLSAGGISVNYRQTETSIQVNESALRLTPSGNQYTRYTEQQREEVEAQIEDLLRARGIANISREHFDGLVNEQLKRLYGSQQQQYHQTPLSPNQGGQKPLSGSVPYTEFTGSGGQKPTPGSVPYTQFTGSGGQNPAPGSVPYTQFTGSGGQKPTPGSVPYTQFTGSGGQKPPPGSVPFTQFHGSSGQNPQPGSAPYTLFSESDEPPEQPDTTQPDYSGSYGFSNATSGGPESDLVDSDDEPFSNKPYSQSHYSRSGKHSNRDGRSRNR